MASCTIYQTVRHPGVSHRYIRKVVQHVLRALGKNKESLSVHLIGDKKMRRLNRQYRGKDKTTDVLSFGLDEGFDIAGSHELGDIFISIPHIRRQAKAFGVPFREECARMLIHGILHLLQYDHVKPRDAKRMFALQERLLREIYY